MPDWGREGLAPWYVPAAADPAADSAADASAAPTPPAT
jgi:hypothetical protein